MDSAHKVILALIIGAIVAWLAEWWMIIVAVAAVLVVLFHKEVWLVLVLVWDWARDLFPRKPPPVPPTAPPPAPRLPQEGP